MFPRWKLLKANFNYGMTCLSGSADRQIIDSADVLPVTERRRLFVVFLPPPVKLNFRWATLTSIPNWHYELDIGS